MRKIASSAASAMLAIGVLTGCSSADHKSGDAPRAAGTSAGTVKESTKPSETAAGKAAKSGQGLKDGRIGDAGTACVLPVSFEAPKGWKFTGFTDEDSELLSKLSGHRSVKGACELSASSTGVIGFIRIYTTDRPEKSPRQVLEDFVAEEKRVSGPEYSETKLGDLPAAEVVYTQQNILTDKPQQRRGVAVKTAKGLTVLHLEGAESDDSKVMIPAYETAKKTMRPAA
ncbi:lipoprotein [Streptomyces orinoci]|uniref:Lipoprotein n=1 Tax=Streptomyces orinoci TaxID=67339 RepID=A0ABV3K4S3_STRON|nr:lipoprotein [Streptomyces orinoci]